MNSLRRVFYGIPYLKSAEKYGWVVKARESSETSEQCARFLNESYSTQIPKRHLWNVEYVFCYGYVSDYCLSLIGIVSQRVHNHR